MTPLTMGELWTRGGWFVTTCFLFGAFQIGCRVTHGVIALCRWVARHQRGIGRVDGGKAWGLVYTTRGIGLAFGKRVWTP